MIKLGDKVKDTVSGMVGIAISRTEFLHGCVRVGVQPQELHEGKPIEAVWIDEPQLDLVTVGVARAYEAVKSIARRAGPRSDARRAADARR